MTSVRNNVLNIKNEKKNFQSNYIDLHNIQSSHWNTQSSAEQQHVHVSEERPDEAAACIAARDGSAGDTLTINGRARIHAAAL